MNAADSNPMSLKVNKAAYLSQHDIVFQTPPHKGWEGLPLGNGSLGGPLWTNEKGYIFQINHTDTFEEPASDPKNDEEVKHILRSCGRLSIEFGIPVFDWLYLNDFEARLSLYRAEAEFSARTAFGACHAAAYIHAEAPVLIMRHKVDYTRELGGQGAPVRIILERWGSRALGGWYGGISGGAGQSLGNTKAWIDGKDICLNVTFRGIAVTLRCRVEGLSANCRLNHSHQAELTIEAQAQQEFTVYLACLTSSESKDPLRDSKTALDRITAIKNPQESHRRWWAFFWSKSFVHISENYFENLYYLHHYLMGSSCRGRYPPLFCGGLWLWNRDVRHWGNPHHWNEQQLFWSLPAANRADLLMPYLDTYHRLMPMAIESTKRKGFQGMRWIDLHDFSGRQVAENYPGFRDNYTPASQMAMFFWWHYLYTGDINYLRAKGYPFMVAAGDFYLGFLRWKKTESQYEIPPASTYENERLFTDTITNLGMIRALFPALIKASQILKIDADKRARWQYVLDHLPPYLLNDRDKTRGITLASGLIDGQSLPETETHNHGPLFCPVFPAGDIGLNDRDSRLFNAAVNTVATYTDSWHACIVPIVVVAARLGMTEEADRRLTDIVRNIQHFPNGLFYNLGHWYLYSRRSKLVKEDSIVQRDYLEDRGCSYNNVNVSASPADGVQEHKADTPCEPFIQPGMETMAHFTAGLQEMLLQSHEGAIRVFPAAPFNWECAFTLLAEGGFMVSAIRRPSQSVNLIEIFSRLGGVCKLILPWIEPAEICQNGQTIPFKQEGHEKIAFETVKGETYFIKPVGVPIPEPAIYTSKPNSAPKHYYEAMIGKPRNY